MVGLLSEVVCVLGGTFVVGTHRTTDLGLCLIILLLMAVIRHQ